MLKKIDVYIMRKFLVTFFVALVLIIALTVVFDASERLDSFMGKAGMKPPTLKEILLDYYGNFIPYFANLFSPFFVFISVIFFTSRMASKLEIISVLSTGTSYWRLLRPFLLSAVIIAGFSFALTNFVIPQANKTKIGFERKFFSKGIASTINFHQNIAENEMVYVERFDHKTNVGIRFSYEKFEDGELTYKLMSHAIRWDSLSGNWIVEDYIIRTFDGPKETFKTGLRIDTIFSFDPSVFTIDLKLIETMNNRELDQFIKKEKERGSKYVSTYLVEKHSRNSNPISTIILTLLAVPIASRKIRGGIGMHLAVGVALAFGYIFMMRITTTYAVNGGIAPFIAVWIPNIIFILIGMVLTRFAQK